MTLDGSQGAAGGSVGEGAPVEFDAFNLTPAQRRTGSASCRSSRTAGGDCVALEPRITVPPHVAGEADVLLAPFQGDTRDPLGCCGSRDTPVPTVTSKSAVGSAIAMSSTAVVAGGACCVLPLVLPVVALGSLGGALASLAAAHGWLTALAAITVASAWLWIWRRAKKRNSRVARSTLTQMFVATAVLAVAMAWPWLESPLLAALSG